MSDVQATTAETAPLSTWYTYKVVNGFTVYDSTVQAEVQPANSSQWPPPPLPDGFTAYFDTTALCWIIGVDVSASPLPALQSLALKEAHQVFSFSVSSLSSGYSQLEQRSWRTQVTDAKTLLGDPTGTPSAMLSALATARSIDVQVLAKSIVSKADTYNAGYVAALAAFQATRDKINEAKTIADLPPFTIQPIPRTGG
jgi:hypothetical protein